MRKITLMAVVIALVFSGCAAKNTSFFYDFKEEKALENSEGKWYTEDAASGASVSSAGYYSFSDDGLIIDDLGITYDKMFLGDADLSYKVRFYLDVNPINEVTFAIGLADGTVFNTATNYLMFVALDVGNIINERYYWVDSNDYRNRVDLNMPQRLLNHNGLNEFQLTKKGDDIDVIMNDVKLAEADFVNYDDVWFTPAIYLFSGGSETEDGFGVLSVEVKFPQATTAPTPEPREGEPV